MSGQSLFTLPNGRSLLPGKDLHDWTGSGAGMAFEDALILSNLLDPLRQSSDIEAAFRTFALVQSLRTQKLTATSRTAGELYELQDEAVGDGLKALQKDISSGLRWIWNHDLVTHLAETWKCSEQVSRFKQPMSMDQTSPNASKPSLREFSLFTKRFIGCRMGKRRIFEPIHWEK